MNSDNDIVIKLQRHMALSQTLGAPIRGRHQVGRSDRAYPPMAG